MLIQKEEVVLTVQLHPYHLWLVIRPSYKYFDNQFLGLSDLIKTTLFDHLSVS